MITETSYEKQLIQKYKVSLKNKKKKQFMSLWLKSKIKKE